MTLTEKVKLLARLREQVAKLQATKKASYEEWLQINKVLLDEIAGLNLEVSTLEELTRKEAITNYTLNGNRYPAPGVEVREFVRLIYQDIDAFDWAVKHQVALSLDKKVFEKIARTTPIEFVTTIQEPKALIAQDLGKVLRVGNEIPEEGR